MTVAVCVEMPPNVKAPELPKEGGKRPDPARHDPQIPPPRPEGHPDAPRADGRPEIPKGENPKADGKGAQDTKS